MRKLVLVVVTSVVLAISCVSENKADLTPSTTPLPPVTPTAVPTPTESQLNARYLDLMDPQFSLMVNAIRDGKSVRGGDRLLLSDKFRRFQSQWSDLNPSYDYLSCHSRINDALTRYIERADALESILDTAGESWNLAYEECKRVYTKDNAGQVWPYESHFYFAGAEIDRPDTISNAFIVPTAIPTARPLPTAPPPPPSSGQATVLITGSTGMTFAGALGEGLDQRSVSGRTPTTYNLRSNFGIFVAVIQKDRENGSLTVEIQCARDGSRQTTTAPFGVVTVTCTD